MTTVAEPALIRAADAAADTELKQAAENANQQLAAARPFAAGRSMQVGGLVPANLEEAVRVAQLLARSALIPKDMRGKPEDVLAALMLGADVGLAPMQALQSIAVINGRPSMWGDGMLAVVMAHPAFEDIAETFDPAADGGTAICQVWRRGRRQPTLATFSHQDAQKAGLLSKDTYKSYERRMLKMRARSWALRDAFPDALRGIVAAEEAMDIPGEVLATEEVRPPIAMPQRLSEATTAPAATTPATGGEAEPTGQQAGSGGAAPVVPAAAAAPASQPAAAGGESLPAAADRIVGCRKNGPSSNGKYWWVVMTERGVAAYTWSTTIGAALEAFHATGDPVDLDTEKDNRGENRIIAVQKFDALGGAGQEG
jgi:hypothetical protein